MDCPEIGAYYQCYKQPKAFLAAVANYRRCYPHGTLVIVSDNGYDYAKAAEHFGADYTHDTEQTGNNTTNALGNKDRCARYLRRFLTAATKIREPYFMYLEDDVLVADRIPANVMDAEVVGANRHYARMPAAMIHNLKRYNLTVRNEQYYGGCGGTIFSTAFYAQLAKVLDIDALLNEYGPLNPAYDSDILVSYLAVRFGGRCTGPPDALTEAFVPGWETAVQYGVAKVVHQFKFLYNKPLTQEERTLLGWTREEDPTHPEVSHG